MIAAVLSSHCGWVSGVLASQGVGVPSADLVGRTWDQNIIAFPKCFPNTFQKNV